MEYGQKRWRWEHALFVGNAILSDIASVGHGIDGGSFDNAMRTRASILCDHLIHTETRALRDGESGCGELAEALRSLLNGSNASVHRKSHPTCDCANVTRTTKSLFAEVLSARVRDFVPPILR